MSQSIFANIDPTNTTGRGLAVLLKSFKEALVSGCSGTTRPSRLQAGGTWVDTTLEGAPNYSWTLKLYTGTVDLSVFQINVLTGLTGINWADGSYTVREITADAVGPILNLVKQRVDNNGQVFSGDTLAEIRIVGRTNSSTDPVVAYIKTVAEENQTTTASGVIVSLYSTPAGSNAAQEHLKFLGRTVESSAGHLFNSMILSQEAVAGSASMVLTSDYVVTEVTGTTAVTIHGIEATSTETQLKIIVNATTQTMTLRAQSGTASAAQRLKTNSAGDDLLLPPGGTVTFYYSTPVESRWKYLSGTATGLLQSLETKTGPYHEWVSPLTGKVRITGYKFNALSAKFVSLPWTAAFNSSGTVFMWGDNFGLLGMGDSAPRSSPVAVAGGIKFQYLSLSSAFNGGIDYSGNGYAWGTNNTGQLGVGDVITRSSPTLVLNGPFSKMIPWSPSYGLKEDGTLYMWGINNAGQLGVGDFTGRSSPVAVLGGLKFADITSSYSDPSFVQVVGIERTAGTPYAWGFNNHGQLGLGDVTPRSSPVAVLGGLKFSKVVGGTNSFIGLSTAGALYGWGQNANGCLGNGDTTSRSSPVAVLGGLTFVDVVGGLTSFVGRTSDGTCYAWGLNTKGLLGVGDNTPRSSPVAVLGGLKFTNVFMATGGSVFGVTEDGSLYAWGDNTFGTLGLGDVTGRSSPVAVLGGLKFSSLREIESAMFGVATNGTLYAWGKNTNGQLGLGDVAARSSPVAVIGGASLYLSPVLIPEFAVVDVVLGTTYKIILGGGACTFGPERIGTNLDKVTIAYET